MTSGKNLLVALSIIFLIVLFAALTLKFFVLTMLSLVVVFAIVVAMFILNL